jgi:hypothetical protein
MAQLSPQGLPRRAAPYLFLTALGLLFFAPQVLHPGQILYGDFSDVWALHLPAKHFLNRSWHETGELPLWCPYRFAGTPFIHDIQVGAFYPLHLPFYLFPESAVGPALSWLIVLHVLLAGWGMNAYARGRALNGAGALVAAAGFMFAGRWMLHLIPGGHYITIGLAWIPWVLLLLEQALQRGSFRWAVAAGCVYALQVLSTQPQWTFYSGLFIIAWTLQVPLERAGFLDGQRPRSWRRSLTELARWAALGATAVVVAVALSAVQLLPTAEAAKHSSRASGVAASPTVEIGLLTLRALVGPAVTTVKPFLEWEERGGLCLVWLAAAGMAPWLCSQRRTRYQAGVCLLLFVFALGGAALVQGLPGFSLFRQPSRMFLVAGFPVAFLAGVTTHALSAKAASVPLSLRNRCRQILVMTAAVSLLLVGSFVLQLWREGVPLRFHAYWPTLLLTVPAAFWLLGKEASAFRSGNWAAAWFGVLLIDLWSLVCSSVQVRSEASVFAPSACVQFLERARPDHGRVLDRDVPGDTGTPLGAGAPLAMLHQLQALRGYTPLDVLRDKEFLQFIGDADEPLRALDNPLVYPAIPDFPVRNARLLDLLGVRYLLQPNSASPVPGSWCARFEDADPRAYDCAAGGVQPTGPYTVYENANVLPRAFVVPEAAPLPERPQVLEALTHTDFRQQVLLEGGAEPAATFAGAFRPAHIRDYQPNRIAVEVPDGAGGYLVLTDIWFPGWRCRVDGQPAPVRRADFLFRAVALPAGAHEVIFTFEPDSYLLGRIISGVAAGLAALILLLPFRRTGH